MLALLALLAGAGFLGWRFWLPPERAPAVTYALIDGQRLSQASLRGKVVLVNFWATSCVICVREMPSLIRLHQQFAHRGFETVAVAMAYDRPDFVLHFARTQALPFPVALDLQGTLAQAYAPVVVTPTTILIGPEGEVIRRWVGEPASWPALESLIESNLTPTRSPRQHGPADRRDSSNERARPPPRAESLGPSLPAQTARRSLDGHSGAPAGDGRWARGIGQS
jgi:peroxiredoxin